jgi:hypothetical protein
MASVTQRPFGSKVVWVGTFLLIWFPIGEAMDAGLEAVGLDMPGFVLVLWTTAAFQLTSRIHGPFRGSSEQPTGFALGLPAPPAPRSAPVNWHADPASAPANWYADPSGQYEYRYWDGGGWTAHVAERGVQAISPLPPPERP